MSFNKLLLFTLVAFLAFVTTFLPLILCFKKEFWAMNPFIIQSTFLVPKFYTALFILIATGLTFSVKNYSDKFFYSGLSLFIAILIYALYLIVYFGYEKAFVKSEIDISYFIFCIPFFIKYLLEIKPITEINGS